MTISSTNKRVDYVGNNSASVYSYNFKIFLASDLVVTTRDLNNIQHTLNLNSDYTVSGAGSVSGGTITLLAGNLATGFTITIERVRPLTQTTDIRNQGDFFPEAHEDEFDNLTMIDQQQQDQIDRSVKLPVSVSPSSVNPTLPVPVANNLLGWDSGGTNLVNIPPIPVVLNSAAAQNVSYVASGSGAVTSDVRTRLRRIINVKDYGAVGDGSTDDTTAINEAIAAASSGGTIYFSPGTYLITTMIHITTSGILFKGDDGASIKSASSPMPGTYNTVFYIDGVNDVGFENLMFLGFNTVPVSGNGDIALYFNNCLRPLVNRCKFSGPANAQGFNIGVGLIGGTKYGKVQNSYFERIVGTLVSGCGYGVLISDSGTSYNTVQNNDFNYIQSSSYGGRHCVYLGGYATENACLHNTMQWCGLDTIVLSSSNLQDRGYNDRVIGNTLVNCGDPANIGLGLQGGIVVNQNREAFVIASNSLKTIGLIGIHVLGNDAAFPTYGKISDNVIQSCQQDAIRVEGATDILVSGNTIIDFSLQTTATYSGIVFASYDNTGSVQGWRSAAVGNMIRQVSSSPAGHYGINILTSVQYCQIFGNVIAESNLTSPYLDSGSNTIGLFKTATGELTLEGAIKLLSTLNVAGNATLLGTLAVTGNVTLTAALAAASGAIPINSPITVSGISTINNDIVLGNGGSYTGAALIRANGLTAIGPIANSGGTATLTATAGMVAYVFMTCSTTGNAALFCVGRGSTTIDLLVQDGGSKFSPTLNNAATINVTYSSGVFSIQNNSATNNINIKTLVMRVA